jgi:activating signal cointegrator 1
MIAFTVRQPYVALIMEGLKTLEIRSRLTKHRGPMALHAAAKPEPPLRVDPADRGRTLPCEEYECDSLPLGSVVCVVDVVDCRPMQDSDREAAFVSDDFPVGGLWVWEFANVRPVKPLPKRGNCAMWHVPDEELEYLTE